MVRAEGMISPLVERADVRRVTRSSGAAAWSGCAALSGVAMLPLFALPSATATALAGLAHALTLAVALTAMIVAARSGDAALRRPRALLSGALAAAAAGIVISIGYVATVGSVPEPSVVDAVSLAWLPLAVAGFWLVPRARGGRSGSARLVADACLTTAALLFTSWITVLGPLIATTDTGALTEVVPLAYPLSDAFVSALVLALLPRVRADFRQFFNCVAAGLVLLALGDSGVVLQVVRHGSASFGWPDVPLQAGCAVLVVAALVRGKPVLRSQRESSLDRNLPQLSIVVACVAGLWHVSNGHNLELAEYVLGAVMMLAAVCRQVLHTHELVRLAEDYREAADRDGLTGLASRKAFVGRLAEHLATPGTGPAAVMLIDLNGFKEVNDTFGQLTGDEVLREVAALVDDTAHGHFLARMGSDEFAVLVVSDEPEQVARAIGTRLAESRRFVTREAEVDVCCSTGIAVAVADDEATDVLKRADLALRAAKSSRVTLVTYSADLGAASDRRHLLIAALAGASARGEMSLVYQPVQRVEDGALVGAEALLRWDHPHFGRVPPDEFIPLAEDAGHIRTLGDWVLQEALSQLAAWDHRGLHLPRVLVNTSADQFTPHLPARVVESLLTRGLTADRLVLEIIESQIPGLTVNDAVHQIREAGVQIALDDFGSGYSSLAQLGRLPVDIVKLDRDFLTNVTDRSGEAVLRAAVSLARSLDLTTVAEGIETEEQLVAVRRAGLDLGQGYLLGRPMPADQLAALLAPRPAAPQSAPGRTSSAAS